MKTQRLQIERLESRAAPAVLFHFTDVDGDRVTMNISKGTSADLGPNFTFSDPNLLHPRYIREIDLAGGANPHVFAGANITLSVTRGSTGDGFTYVGWINATGIDLGAVTIHGDLGMIVCGDGVSKTDALKSLNVQSLGRFGTNTGAPNLDSTIDGRLGSLAVTGDVQGVFFDVIDSSGKHRASIGSATIGGSLKASAWASFATIESEDDIGPLRIGHDVGSAGNDGVIYGKGKLASITIGGSLIGGTGFGSGRILSGHGIGPIKIGGDVVGGSGQFSGQIAAGNAGGNGSIVRIAIGGSLLGGGAADSGEISSASDMGPVKIGGDMVGGDGFKTGSVECDGKLAGVTVGGSIIGGSGGDSGEIYGQIALGPVKVGDDVKGYEGGAALSFSGCVTSSGALNSVTIGGSLQGGDGEFSGEIASIGNIGMVTIGHDLRGGLGSQSGVIESSGGKIGAVVIGGSTFYRGAGDATISMRGDIGAIKIGGDIHVGTFIGANGKIGSITVNGSMGGAAFVGVRIVAQGKLNPASQADSVAIGRITVGGSVTKTRIEAGYDTAGNAINADASIGSVRIGADWIASDLIAGVKDGGDGYFGNVGLAIDDTVIPGGNPAILAKIGSITIGGQIIGTPSLNGDSYAFAAEMIGSMKIGGTTVTLPGPHNNFNFTDPSLSDVTVEEI